MGEGLSECFGSFQYCMVRLMQNIFPKRAFGDLLEGEVGQVEFDRGKSMKVFPNIISGSFDKPDLICLF